MKIVLSPNPYRDKGLKTAQNAERVLRQAGVETCMCFPFELEREHVEVPAHLEFLPEEEARRMLGEDRKILLVDVRPSGDYALGHRPGSINIPLKDLYKNPRMICPDVKAAVFLYCAGGYQSVLAAGLLADAGYENVCVIPGLSQTN